MKKLSRVCGIVLVLASVVRAVDAPPPTIKKIPKPAKAQAEFTYVVCVLPPTTSGKVSTWWTPQVYTNCAFQRSSVFDTTNWTTICSNTIPRGATVLFIDCGGMPNMQYRVRETP